MIKRSENHEKYCNGDKPHIYLGFRGIGLIETGRKADNEILSAIARMDRIWASELSKRIKP